MVRTMLCFFFSSALETVTKKKVAIKKLARPFQSAVHAKRTYRELKLLKHMRHENVIGLLDVFYPKHDNSQVSCIVITNEYIERSLSIYVHLYSINSTVSSQIETDYFHVEQMIVTNYYYNKNKS